MTYTSNKNRIIIEESSYCVAISSLVKNSLKQTRKQAKNIPDNLSMTHTEKSQAKLAPNSPFSKIYFCLNLLRVFLETIWEKERKNKS